MNERGGFPLVLAVLVVGFFVVLWLAVDACVGDPGEGDDLGHTTWVAV